MLASDSQEETAVKVDRRTAGGELVPKWVLSIVWPLLPTIGALFVMQYRVGEAEKKLDALQTRVEPLVIKAATSDRDSAYLNLKLGEIQSQLTEIKAELKAIKRGP